MGESINIGEYLDIFKKRKKMIILMMIIFLSVGGFLQYRNAKSYVPTYSSNISVRINVNKNIATEEEATAEEGAEEEPAEEPVEESAPPVYRGSSLESSALNQSIAEKYSVLATSKRAMTELKEKLNLEVSPESLGKTITVVPQEGLMEFIDITAVSADPNLAQSIAATVPEVFNNEIKNVIGLDCVEVLYGASEPMMNPKPRDLTLVKVAGVGLALVIFMVLLLECLDNKVVTPEDAEKYWGVPVIGVIPFDKEEAKGKKVAKASNQNINTKSKSSEVGV